jgi:serine/threonine protein kinase
MDPHPPLPSFISPVCEDFLLQCFHKEPSLRKTAVELLKHPWITQTNLQYPRIIPSSSPSSLGAKANSSRKNTVRSESYSSSNFSSFKSDTWGTFGNGSSGAYETVLHQKKDESKISNTDKLRAYLESDSDDDSILDSESYEELQIIDLEKRLDNSSRTFSVGSDANIFQDDDVDLKINEIKKLEDETAKILRSISSDSNSNDILNLLEQLRQRSEDEFMLPMLIRTLLSESMIPLLSLLEYQNPAVVASILKLLLDVQKNDQIKEKLTIIGLFPMLSQVIYSWDLPEIQEDVVSLIYYFIYHNTAYAKLFVASGCFPVIVKLLQNGGMYSD